ncbi:hypothetical protein GCM10011320_22080 [Neoroseomonas lacus]|uniref:Uncharacterized protein n=2 Tax=Neoroseomonas lacus TaxID=287609 RepID=A0A917NQ58_9PROT|nr:hypothetical protein GCM10011320_22080 [Neoroseomonas lacus]
MNTQLRLIFGTPDADVARRLVRRRNYIIGRFDHLERFLSAVEAVSGLKRKEPLPHRNAKPKGVTTQRAVEQPDYAEAVEELSVMNAGDISFFKTMPPLLVTTAST